MSLVCVCGAYINKSVFRKNLLGIEKVVKILLIPDKIFSKNDILLCALKAHISKIHTHIYIYIYTHTLILAKKKKKNYILPSLTISLILFRVML